MASMVAVPHGHEHEQCLLQGGASGTQLPPEHFSEEPQVSTSASAMPQLLNQ